MMKCVVVLVVLLGDAAAFIGPGITWSARAAITGSTSEVCCSRHPSHKRSEIWGRRSKLHDEDHERDAATNEKDPPTTGEMTDVELEELLKGLNIGSPGKASRSGGKGRGELDEMKLILALRKQMGEADFYTVFDPRNPRIGDM